MKILLVAATEFEIAPLLKKLGKKNSKRNFISFRKNKNQIDVLITGVGMTATAFWLGKILNKKYSLAINLGLAGSFNKNISPGTVVNVVSDCFADLGAEDGNNFLTAEEIGLTKSSKFNTKKFIHALPKVNGITVNTVHGNEASIKKVVKKFNPDTESMEGAAFFYACAMEKIPSLQIRAISNYVERRNKKRWKTALAIRKLNKIAGQIILLSE